MHDAISELVETVKGNVFFEGLVQILFVSFFKHRQNSVISYPVEYLREWCAILGFFEEEKEEDDTTE